MKKILPLLLLSILVIYLGCGKDDPPPAPKTDTVYRVVAYKAGTAPSLNDVHDNIWDNATETSLDMTRAGALPQSVSATESGPKVSAMQAIVNGGYLYLRFIWNDATHDIWRNGFYVTDTAAFVHFRQFDSLTYGEDQLFVMFDKRSGDGWDAWNWRAASLAPAGLAEDRWFKYVDSFYTNINSHLESTQVADSFVYEVVYDTTTMPGILPFFVKDSATSQVPIVGWPNDPFGVGLEPTYVSRDTSEFKDSVLYLWDAIDRGDTLSYDSTILDIDSNATPWDTTWGYVARFWYQTKGWTLNQKVPGYLIDDSARFRPPEQIGSLFDVRTASEFKGEQYIVVMRRLLNTGHPDDLNLNTDSVKTRVVISNNMGNIFDAFTDRSISDDVWLILK